MPKDGFKSLTVKEEVYDELMAAYEQVKKPMILLGVNSFSGFISFAVNKLFTDEKVFQAFIDSMDSQHKAAFEKLRSLGHV